MFLLDEITFSQTHFAIKIYYHFFGYIFSKFVKKINILIKFVLFFPSFLQSVVSGKHLQCPQEASASSPAPSASDLSTPVSPELSSNGAFLYSYGNFIDQAPLGQVVNIVENQDGLDKNTARSNSGNGSPQTPGSKDNSVQVGVIYFIT